MLNKENYVPWSSRLLRYTKSRPNGKLIYNSIINGPIVRRMIPELGDTARAVPVPKTFHEQTNYELTKANINNGKQNDHAILDHLLGLPEDSISYEEAILFKNGKFTSTRWQSIDRHVTIVHQTKDLHTADYTQLYDFLKYNQKEVDDLRADGLAKTQDPLALMAISNNPFNYLVFHPDQPSPNCSAGYEFGSRLSDADGWRKLGESNVGNQNGQIVVPRIANHNGNGNVVSARAVGNVNGNNGNQIRCYNCRGLGHLARKCTVRPRKRDVAYLQTQLLVAQKEEAGIQLQAEEFDLMAAAADLEEIKEVNSNCILMANCSKHRHRNNSNVISAVSSVEQGGGTVEQHSTTVEERHVYHESLFHNLDVEVEKVNLVNHKMKETNAELTTELARYKNQEKCFKISLEKYEKLERCYQKSIYQEQCLTKKINALHLSSGKQTMALSEEISNLNKQLLKEKATVSSLQEEKKRLKSDFKIREDEFLDK
ncbi:retrovirus-related pol polyprotein from transposon TNT 1-94 [Tanacetum coccineum]